MGEALIVRRGGGGSGGFSLEKEQVIESWGGSATSTALDASKTYVLFLESSSAEDGELDAKIGVFMLEGGTITAVYDGDSFLSKKAVSFNATNNKITVKCVATYFGSTWEHVQLAICKVN